MDISADSSILREGARASPKASTTPLILRKRRRISELADPTPSKLKRTVGPTLAESVQKFQTRTPPRFRSISAKPVVQKPVVSKVKRVGVAKAAPSIPNQRSGSSATTVSARSVVVKPAISVAKPIGSILRSTSSASVRTTAQSLRRRSTVFAPFNLSSSNRGRSSSASSSTNASAGSSPKAIRVAIPRVASSSSSAMPTGVKGAASKAGSKVVVQLKGCYGVSRPTKKPATVFKEFKLHTDARADRKRIAPAVAGDFKKSSPAKKMKTAHLKIHKKKLSPKKASPKKASPKKASPKKQ